MTYRFYKDKDGWFIDFQEAIDAGIYSKANLAMVLGADTLLDTLSNNGKEIIVRFEDKKFKGWEGLLEKEGISQDEEALEALGHPVQYGGDYICTKLFGKKYNHKLWLCEVAAYLLNGFPDKIYIKIET